MKYVNQISVFVTNKTGSLAEVTKLLADAEIGLRAFSIADTSEFGILRMIVDQTEKAVDVLKAAHVTVLKTPVLAIITGLSKSSITLSSTYFPVLSFTQTVNVFTS